MKHVVAIGGGGFSDHGTVTPLDLYLLSLADTPRPRVCFIPTASGDASDYIDKFMSAFAAASCDPSVLSLFRREYRTTAAALTDVDVVYVGGGNTANLLALWRLHGLDGMLSDDAGPAVVGGISAGGMCWFEAGVTDSFGLPKGPLRGGLGWIPGSFCPHFSADDGLRNVYSTLVADGSIPAGYGVDDGAALHFINGQLQRAVAEDAHANAYYVGIGTAGATGDQEGARRVVVDPVRIHRL